MNEPVRRVEESCGVQAWMWDRGEVVWVSGCAEGEGRLGDAVKRLERHRQALERYGNKFKFAAMDRICGFSSLLAGDSGVGLGVVGWKEVIIIAHGPRWSLLARLFTFRIFLLQSLVAYT